VIFRLNKEEFGLDIKQVIEIMPLVMITEIPAADGSAIEGVINLRGQIIPVMNLRSQFNFPKIEKLEKTARIVVVDLKLSRLGLLVDEVPEVLKIAENKIEAVPELIKKKIPADYIKGVGKTGDRLIIILDPGNFAAFSEEASKRQSEKGETNG